jgi:hypothetical protein
VAPCYICFWGGYRASFEMSRIGHKERYRQRAALCYEIAGTMPRDKSASMKCLGDIYAGLAEESDKPRTGIFVATERKDRPQCVKCRKEMRFTYSLPRTETLPAMQAFCCDRCNETMIWKGK